MAYFSGKAVRGKLEAKRVAASAQAIMRCDECCDVIPVQQEMKSVKFGWLKDPNRLSFAAGKDKMSWVVTESARELEIGQFPGDGTG